MKNKPASNRVEMVDKVFNYWRVIEVDHSKNKIVYYKCECLRCNTIHIVDGRNVRSGRSKMCIDCGHKENVAKRLGVPHSEDRKSNISIAKVCKELANINDTMKPNNGGLEISKKIDWIKASAKNRSYSWELTKLEAAKLIVGSCNYCKSKPNPFHGLDRVDNEKGYEIDNVVPCCKRCNSAKNDMTVEEFKEWIRNVYANIDNF